MSDFVSVGFFDPTQALVELRNLDTKRDALRALLAAYEVQQQPLPGGPSRKAGEEHLRLLRSERLAWLVPALFEIGKVSPKVSLRDLHTVVKLYQPSASFKALGASVSYAVRGREAPTLTREGPPTRLISLAPGVTARPSTVEALRALTELQKENS